MLLQISELFSSFDDQPMQHQIELIEALEEFLNTWMIKNGLNGYDRRACFLFVVYGEYCFCVLCFYDCNIFHTCCSSSK